jgi:hypothetical protein
MIQGLVNDYLKVLLDILFTLAYYNMTELITNMHKLMIQAPCITFYDARNKGDLHALAYFGT